MHLQKSASNVLSTYDDCIQLDRALPLANNVQIQWLDIASSGVGASANDSCFSTVFNASSQVKFSLLHFSHSHIYPSQKSDFHLLPHSPLFCMRAETTNWIFLFSRFSRTSSSKYIHTHTSVMQFRYRNFIQLWKVLRTCSIGCVRRRRVEARRRAKRICAWNIWMQRRKIATWELINFKISPILLISYSLSFSALVSIAALFPWAWQCLCL